MGALRCAGDGDWSSRGERTGPEEVVFTYLGVRHDFPADAEVPLDTVREAMWELLTTGGRRPGCVTRQEDRGWTATPGTARHAHRARTHPTPDPG
ncbi:Imm1 family immunity protein [Saccharothrix sp. BKS2]|uniref:Imm1 family immunity protein n=1 Tax=Saccharothrix sp. BKS2 TaxID=3064400 RepID=UPI0039ED3042